MKQLRFPLAAIVLALVFSVSALAGDIQCGVTSQPPNSTTSAASLMPEGDTPMGEVTNSETGAVDPVAETALYLTLSVLSLF